jgi:hypothetical protein
MSGSSSRGHLPHLPTTKHHEERLGATDEWAVGQGIAFVGLNLAAGNGRLTRKV